MTTEELQAMLTSDEHHWWYRGRRRVLRAELDRLPIGPAARLLDAGCGSGRTLDELSDYGQVSGLDLSPVAAAAAQHRGHSDVHVGAVEQMPFGDETFDVVTCLDVIEHTPDDHITLRELLRVTRPGGLLLATVPAYQSLWSQHDEANLHYRRYNSRALRAAGAAAGWDVIADTHFNSLLLAPAAIVRIAQRHRRGEHHSDLAITPPALNRLLELPLAAEARLLAHGRRLPFGLSLLAVMQRPDVDRPEPFVSPRRTAWPASTRRSRGRRSQTLPRRIQTN